MKTITLLFTLILFLGTTEVAAQELRLESASFYGFVYPGATEYFYGGGGLSLNYGHHFEWGRVQAGMEYRIIDWGNQLGLNLGYAYPLWTKAEHSLSAGLMVQLGIVPFRQNSLFAWGAEPQVEYRWQTQKRAFWIAGVGVRYSHSPAYLDFGPINRLGEMALRAGIGWRLH